MKTHHLRSHYNSKDKYKILKVLSEPISFETQIVVWIFDSRKFYIWWNWVWHYDSIIYIQNSVIKINFEMDEQNVNEYISYLKTT